MLNSLPEILESRIARLPRTIRLMLAFGCGAVMVPAMPPWCFWPFLIIGLSGFYLLLPSAHSVRFGLALGWCFGFGYFVFGLSWIANALLVEGNDFAWVWPLAIAGLPAGLAFFPALASAAAVKFGRFVAFSGYLFFTAVLMAAEWLRGHIFTGFPWNLFGYTWAETLPLAQLAAVGGIYWLTALTTLGATLPGFLLLWQRPAAHKIIALGLLLAVAGAAWLYGSQRLIDTPTSYRKDAAIRLVQPNIAQEDKWNPEKSAENLNRLLSLSEARQVNRLFTTIIVWPETAITSYLLDNPAASAAIKTVLSGYHSSVYLLSGVMRVEKEQNGNNRYFNSLVAYDKQMTAVATFDKSHLVPFGEYIPLQRYVPLQPFVQFAGFEAGNGPQSLPLADHGHFSPLVCYEIIFPGAVTDPEKRPGFIVNVTNDSWYGDSAGPRQHFAMAQFRAIEEGIPVVRSANTGISGIIDSLGRTTRRYALLTAHGENAPLPSALPDATLFATLKDSLFWCMICILLLIAYAFQRDTSRMPKNRK